MMNYLSLLNDKELITIYKYFPHTDIPTNFMSRVGVDLIAFMYAKFSRGRFWIDNNNWQHSMYYNRDYYLHIDILDHSNDGFCYISTKIRMVANMDAGEIMICEDCIADGASEYSLR